MTAGMTAYCVNPACPEHEVEKDLSMMPPGYTDTYPVYCGGCGAIIPVDAEQPDNTLPDSPDGGGA